MTKKMKVFAGIDDGYDETDGVISLGDTLRMPSMAKAGESSEVTLGIGEQKTFGYQTGDGNFVVGSLDHPDSTASDKYPLSAMNRSIVMHALRQLGLDDRHEVILSTGLPIKRYYRNGVVNQEFVKAKRDNLLKNDVQAMDGTGLPKIISHFPVAEGIAAWFDLVTFREDGVLQMDQDMAKERTAIIDIGGRTTDVAYINGGSLDMDKSTTIDIGMLAIKDRLRERIYSDRDVEPSIAQLNQAIHTGKMRLYGENEGVEDILKSESETVLRRIETEVRRVLHNGADVDSIVFVGGTAAALEDLLTGWFRNQRHADDPATTNARGMCAFAELSSKQG